MKLSCLHTHTTFCDGKDTIDTICKSAYEKGFASIGFSSHSTLPKGSEFESGWHIKNYELDAYAEVVLKAKKAWEGRLTIFLGLEIDYIEGITGPREERFQKLGLDYSIGSVHYLLPPNGTRLVPVDGPLGETAAGIQEGFGGDGNAYMHAYWKAVQNMIAEGGFDILGHFDLIKKNNQNGELFSLTDKKYLNAAEQTVGKLAGTSIVAEVNTGGLNRGITKDCYPSLQILTMMRTRQIPVCVNADAHKVGDICGHYGTAIESLREAGYKSVQFFEGRESRGEAQSKTYPLWSALPLELVLNGFSVHPGFCSRRT